VQNTRLNTLVNVSQARLARWLSNPWRRTSLSVISLLFGFLLASIFTTSFGARSDWDTFTAGLIVLLSELISRFVYSPSRQVLSDGSLAKRSLSSTMLNCLKLGVLYGMCLEAFKLGS
jgi:L-lactate permease